MSEPLISIVTPTFNRPSWLNITLQSLLNQTYQKWEVIVVNDRGTNVSSVVEKFQDKRMRYFENEKNIGLAATRNVAMSLAKGDYFVFLDDDDILLPLSLEIRLEQLLKRKVEIVYTRALQNIYEPMEGGYKISHRQLYWDSPFNRDLILIQNIAPCLCPLFSRKAWDDTGNYKLDESLSSTEDHDFWCSLSRHNSFEELKIIDAECSYRTDGGQMTGTRDFSVNWIKVFKKWRHTAMDLQRVTESQNNILKSVGINPQDYGL
jgi:glycosyltransferase involved in cell wall biosynthesis